MSNAMRKPLFSNHIHTCGGQAVHTHLPVCSYLRNVPIHTHTYYTMNKHKVFTYVTGFVKRGLIHAS